MKTYFNKIEPEFTPVEIKILFETEQDVQDFLDLISASEVCTPSVDFDAMISLLKKHIHE